MSSSKEQIITAYLKERKAIDKNYGFGFFTNEEKYEEAQATLIDKYIEKIRDGQYLDVARARIDLIKAELEDNFFKEQEGNAVEYL